WGLTGDAKRIGLLATGVEEGKAQPLLWTRAQGKGRVFVSILGHYNWTFDDPLFRLLVLRGLCWSAGERVDRLSELATVGAGVGRWGAEARRTRSFFSPGGARCRSPGHRPGSRRGAQGMVSPRPHPGRCPGLLQRAPPGLNERLTRRRARPGRGRAAAGRT